MAVFVKERPLVLVCPGGGYEFTSDREAEIVALQFNAMGYHTAVLRYSCTPAVFPTAVLELSKAVAYFREHAGEYCIDPERIAVLGFSAGGHLAASLSVFWNTEWFAKIRKENGVDLTAQQIRPDGLILAYPVITSGEHAHRDSFDKLLGEKRSSRNTDKHYIPESICGQHCSRRLWNSRQQFWNSWRQCRF